MAVSAYSNFSKSTNFVYFIHHQFVHFIDLEKPVHGFMNKNLISSIPTMNPLPKLEVYYWIFHIPKDPNLSNNIVLHDFWRKIFITLYSSLPDWLRFLRYWAICILWLLFVSDVISFEITLTFLIKPFSYMTKKSGQKSKYQNIIFQEEVKTIFKGVSFITNCLSSKSGPF